MTVYAAILAGGVGSRLWPRSRRTTPKQFSDIEGAGRTMIQATADRLTDLVATDSLYVLTGERYATLATAQLDGMPAANCIVEPSGRNTAPAIALACVHLQKRDPEAVVIILPADSVITDGVAYLAALRRAVVAAEAGYLVTLGIEAELPHTGYGYIQRGEPALADDDPSPVFTVKRFLEKPDEKRAKEFLASGDYYWNGGIFVAKVATLVAEFARQAPEIYRGMQQLGTALSQGRLASVLPEIWPQMPSISIDYAILEGAQNVAMTPLRAGWNDVGSWDALKQIIAPDSSGNLPANSEVIAVNSVGNIVYSENKVVALVGVDDLVIVETEDALLVGRQSDMQNVKAIVELLQAANRDELL